ncbi:EAL domain-containing protein [Thalassobacillus hwangdonensis]|uniref:EAL domain-containing protein n=1 Tax=Thalassobacillus hwangdonensis TaxID=546108 RepID=A0ABW3L4S0_9BACI
MKTDYMPLTVAESFYHNYQPIFNLRTWNKTGYEVLFRSKIHATPVKAFQIAKKEKNLFKLDIESIKLALHNLSTFQHIHKGAKLFINVYPSTILHPDFNFFFKEHIHPCVQKDSLVFELNESEELDHPGPLVKKLDSLKSSGLKIAIDDFGAGRSDMMNLLELNPDYIKVDRYITSELDTSPKKQEFLQYLVNYSRRFNIKLILEGIETSKELTVAKMLGVTYAQGFLLGKPQKLM